MVDQICTLEGDMFVEYCKTCRAFQWCTLTCITEVGYLYQAGCGHQIAVTMENSLYHGDVSDDKTEEEGNVQENL